MLGSLRPIDNASFMRLSWISSGRCYIQLWTFYIDSVLLISLRFWKFVWFLVSVVPDFRFTWSRSCLISGWPWDNNHGRKRWWLPAIDLLPTLGLLCPLFQYPCIRIYFPGLSGRPPFFVCFPWDMIGYDRDSRSHDFKVYVPVIWTAFLIRHIQFKTMFIMNGVPNVTFITSQRPVFTKVDFLPTFKMCKLFSIIKCRRWSPIPLVLVLSEIQWCVLESQSIMSCDPYDLQTFTRSSTFLVGGGSGIS